MAETDMTMQTELTDRERDALVERIARWAASLKIGGLIAFMLEINRPVAPLSGNACIAVAPMLGGAAPIPLNALGVLLQDDAAVMRLCERIRQLERDATDAVAQPALRGGQP
jgi:hypothetical protein